MVVSPYLKAAGAHWVNGAVAGGWIGERLAAFGPSVGHAVPLGYADYAVVPITPHEEGEPAETFGALEPLLDVLAPLTGDQVVYTGIWDGWDIFYETGTRPQPTGAGVYWDPDGPRPSAEERERALAEARAEVAEAMVEYPDLPLLELPARRYPVWAGPLRSALALDDWLHFPPSLIWPQDRSWFVGIPIYTAEIAVGGPEDVIAAVLAEPGLGARRVRTDHGLDIDD